MKEWLLENLNWIVPCVTSVLSGLGGCTIFSLIRTIQLSHALTKARESKYWTVCPRCKKRIYLDEIQFHMPNGLVDDNLNGKADSEE